MTHQSVSIAMSFGETLFWFFVGILISVAFPIAVKTLRKKGLEARPKEPPPTLTQRILDAWHRYGGNKYLALLIAAVVVAVVLVFLLGLQFYTPRDAALAGIGWESLVNKLYSGQ